MTVLQQMCTFSCGQTSQQTRLEMKLGHLSVESEAPQVPENERFPCAFMP